LPVLYNDPLSNVNRGQKKGRLNAKCWRTPNLQMTHCTFSFCQCTKQPKKCHQHLNISSELNYLKQFRKLRLLSWTFHSLHLKNLSSKRLVIRPNWCFSEFLLIRKWFIPDILSWIQECVFSYICWKSLSFGKPQQRIHRIINYISYINMRFSLDHFVVALREFQEFNQKNSYKYYVGSWVNKQEHPFKSHIEVHCT
jgi:hypothetical protein